MQVATRATLSENRLIRGLDPLSHCYPLLLPMSVQVLLLLATLFSIVSSCDLNVTFIAFTSKPVFFQVKSFDGSLSQLYHFEKNQQEQKLRLKGEDCALHTTEVSTYKDVDGVKGPLVHNTMSLLEGTGTVTYWVTDDLWARMVSRTGVLCAIECGGRG
uniref:NTR domain-containing protein n=2 Tax=Steinernema glaseri TaxID=37863 RepID=A0A1I7Y595_9BILA